jgi:hypothetical protein
MFGYVGLVCLFSLLFWGFCASVTPPSALQVVPQAVAFFLGYGEDEDEDEDYEYDEDDEDDDEDDEDDSGSDVCMFGICSFLLALAPESEGVV